jgi:cytoskeleton protein RodZ
VKHLLIVEPDPVFRTLLEETVHGQAAVDTVADFPAARTCLVARPPDLVVTNLRLGAFNGLHLAYLLAGGDWPSRGVVYSESLDVSLAHAARRAGAFWEFQQRLPSALPAYLHANLPARDRRDPVTPDRRSACRGGRRASDIAGPRSGAQDRIGTGRARVDAVDVGGALRDARQRRGISLDRLAQATKIRVTTLRAIETNRREKLPEAIFLRGFVRAYAREVGQNPEDTARQYLAQFEPVPEVVERVGPQMGDVRREHTPGTRSFMDHDEAERRVTRIQWLGLMMLFIGVAAYYAGQWRTVPPAAHSTPLANGTEIARPSSADGSPTAAATARTEVATTGSSELKGASSATDLLHFDIQAQGLCWLSATVDGTRVVHRLMRPGEQYMVDVHEKIVLRIGAPEAFAFSINGREGRLPGNAGEPLTVHITPQNYREFVAHQG